MRTLKELSDYQLKLILLMQGGNQLVHNEGANFRAWMENGVGDTISFSVRKDSADKLFEQGWMKEMSIEGSYRRIFRHTLSKKAEERISQAYGEQLKRVERLKGVLKKTKLIA